MTTAQRRSFPIGTAILGLLILIGLVVAGIRYARGIGAISNLSDGRPWGLWISFDLYCGVALAAGGFVLAATVYLFHLKKYYPIIRSAILTAFLGYLLVVFALLVDLGQPWRIWHALIYWNLHSPLFEVAWCVMLYTTVLALEFSPVVFERLNWQIPIRVIRRIQIPLVLMGVVLSTMHQSSLGSMLLMMPDKVNRLWYTPILPILFLLSAIAVGLAMTIVESSLSSRAFKHHVSSDILAGLGRAIPYVLGIYLVVKLGDLLLAGELGLIFREGAHGIRWLVEVIGGVIVPIILFSLPRVRRSPRALFWSAVIVVFGLVLNRFNVSWLSLAGRPGVSYAPHWMEFAITIGLLSGGVLVFMLANRYLPVAHHSAAEPG
jgi:Ni/Fe-hydrogenase subunit HybB-like protein